MKNNTNILLLCADQQRFDTLGCYQNEFVETPNIDELANKGVLFEKAYSQNPVCTPSRSSFLTGRYPRTTGCRQNGQDIPDTEILLTKVLADNGYTCGVSGKFHLSSANPANGDRVERRISDGIHVFEWSHDSNLRHASNAYHRWLRGNNIEYKVTKSKESFYVDYGMPAEWHLTKFCADKAIEFIKVNEDFDNPWMFMVNFFDPHAPFDPPREYLEKYLSIIDELPLPNYVEGELDNKPYIQKLEHTEAVNSRRKFEGKESSFPASKMNEDDHKYIKAAYYAMCDFIDDQVGRIIKALKDSGQYNDTIIVYMSDHGELLGDHGMYYKGPFFYDPCIHVPYIYSYPKKFLQNKRIEKTTELIGLMPTLLEAVGIEIPASVQGESMYEVLCGTKEPKNTDVYCEYYNSLPWNNPKIHATMVMDERYKVVVYHNIDDGELYDLKNDINESVNLWNIPNMTEAKIKMLIKLSNKMAFTADPLPQRRAAW
jgi:arylsulfatase